MRRIRSNTKVQSSPDRADRLDRVGGKVTFLADLLVGQIPIVLPVFDGQGGATEEANWIDSDCGETTNATSATL